MKCIKNDKTIKRVSDNDAYELVKNGWEFCPKSEWKKNVRDSVKGSVKDFVKESGGIQFNSSVAFYYVY